MSGSYTLDETITRYAEQRGISVPQAFIESLEQLNRIIDACPEYCALGKHPWREAEYTQTWVHNTDRILNPAPCAKCPPVYATEKCPATDIWQETMVSGGHPATQEWYAHFMALKALR